MQETIVALATPVGIGAIGVIRLSGFDAIDIAQSVFSKKITNKLSHTLHFGRITSPPGPLSQGATGETRLRVLDEVVLSLFKGPNSYTGEDVVEISCHGSHFIQQKIIEPVASPSIIEEVPFIPATSNIEIQQENSNT